MKIILSKIVFSALLVITTLQAYSQVTKTLTLDEFSKISLNISADVYIELGNKQEVIVEGTQKLIDLLETDIKGEKWSIEYSENNVRTNNNLTIRITLPLLESAKVNSSGDIHGKGTFKADDFKASINGSGDLTLILDVKELDLSINGSGDMHLSGKAESVDISINGSGDIKAGELACNVADANINGSGDIYVQVNNRLEAHINGSGDINYTGDPDIKTRSYGSGDVRKKS